LPDHLIQASFNSGEWSPKLFARVDLTKYRSGAALLENFFVDYRGGASTRPGTKYIIQCYKSATAVRLIQFQASFSVGYVLEFGDQYIRFISNGSPILEAGLAISAASTANPCVIQVPGNTYLGNDWIFISGVNGMTQLNSNYYRVASVSGANVTLSDLNGLLIDSTHFTAFSSGGTAARIYTIPSPYLAADLQLIKYAQNVGQLILCHPKYQPYILNLITATNWTLLPITFGASIGPPGFVGLNSTSLTSGPAYYAYLITAIDGNGQESVPSAQANFGPFQDLRTTAGSMNIGWTGVPGAVGYNIYKSNVSYVSVVVPGVTFGFIGSTTGLAFSDSNISPDFTQTPPVAKNPFIGSGVASITVTAAGTYTAVPAVSLTGAASTIAGSISAVLQVQGTPTIGAGGAGYVVNDTVTFSNGVVLIVATVTAGAVTTWKPANTVGGSVGSVSAGSTPANPVVQLGTSGIGTGATANLTWGVGLVQILNPGAGYTSIPTVTYASGAAAATATLGAASNGFPSVPGFFQQRLVLASPIGAPSTFYTSQPGQYFNYNVSVITQADDSITGTLVSGQLNTIKSMVPQTSGLLMFTDRTSWLINGGSPGSAISPAALVANPQSFNGISDIPPIVANFDVLYVQAKGSIVRDSAYNIYANVYTGTDITALASHLFYGFTVTGWAWAEEPYKVVWAIRSDGVMLTLTFLKEQEFIGWSHSTTVGSFKSVTTIIENTSTSGEVDAVYTVVQRTINGNTIQYIERVAERIFLSGVADAWCVDCGIAYNGSPASTFAGAQFLAGATVTGLADGKVIPSFTMPISGTFTLSAPASKVVIGLPFTCKLQTLALEMGDPTIQGKVKKINAVDVRVAETLGLTIGPDFNHLVPMKDLIVGNVSSMLTGQQSQIVTDLVTGDARTFLSPAFTVPGQYCIQQSQPLPASILGVIPDFTLGDDGGKR
jgi:hypothetical protein